MQTFSLWMALTVKVGTLLEGMSLNEEPVRPLGVAITLLVMKEEVPSWLAIGEAEVIF